LTVRINNKRRDCGEDLRRLTGETDKAGSAYLHIRIHKAQPCALALERRGSTVTSNRKARVTVKHEHFCTGRLCYGRRVVGGAIVDDDDSNSRVIA
jgi:hypothetical protein